MGQCKGSKQRGGVGGRGNYEAGGKCKGKMKKGWWCVWWFEAAAGCTRLQNNLIFQLFIFSKNITLKSLFY